MTPKSKDIPNDETEGSRNANEIETIQNEDSPASPESYDIFTDYDGDETIYDDNIVNMVDIVMDMDVNSEFLSDVEDFGSIGDCLKPNHLYDYESLKNIQIDHIPQPQFEVWTCGPQKTLPEDICHQLPVHSDNEFRQIMTVIMDRIMMWLEHGEQPVYLVLGPGQNQVLRILLQDNGDFQIVNQSDLLPPDEAHVIRLDEDVEFLMGEGEFPQMDDQLDDQIFAEMGQEVEFGVGFQIQNQHDQAPIEIYDQGQGIDEDDIDILDQEDDGFDSN